MNEIFENDIIQIAPHDAVRDMFHGKPAIVESVRGWGVVARVETFDGDAYIRLAWGSFVRIGPAVFVREGVGDG